MGIDGVRGLGSIDPQRVYGIQQEETPGKGSFAETLQDALSEVGRMQVRRDDMVEGMVSGAPSEAHDVMIASEEAQLSFELMVEIRNKLLEAYQEIMRMQG